MGDKKGRYIRRQIGISACLNIGHLMIGYTVAWTAPIVPKLQDPKQSPLSTPISLAEASWVGSSFTVGVIIGPYLMAYLANIIGRKYSLVLSGLLNSVGYLFLALAKSLPVILVGRVISGFGLGSIAVINLVYIGEIASPNIRGIMLTLTGVYHTFGTLVVYSMGPFLSYLWIAYFLLFVSFVYIAVCIAYVPESPLFYVLRGREEDAIKVLHHLGRDKDIYTELKCLNDSIDCNRSNWKWRELFTNKVNRKSLIITLSLYICQECCGILSVAYFATTIFQKAGSSIDPPIATIIIGITQFVTTFTAPSFIEKLGRKTLLLVSTAGCGICMASLGLYFYLDFREHSLVSSVGWLPLLLLAMSYCSYSIGLNIVPNTLLGEMYSPSMRSIGTSVSMTIGWLSGFFCLASFGYIVDVLGSYVIFWTFAAMNIIGFIFIALVVPETKGMSLREIETILSK